MVFLAHVYLARVNILWKICVFLNSWKQQQEVTLSQIGGPDGHNLYGGPRGGPPPGGPYGPGPHDLLDGPPHGIPPFVDDVPYYGVSSSRGGPPPPWLINGMFSRKTCVIYIFINLKYIVRKGQLCNI